MGVGYAPSAVPSLPSLVRARAALPADPPSLRRDAGVVVLDGLRVAARAVDALLPELSVFARYASRPEAATLSVGWRVRDASNQAPRLALTVDAQGYTLTWGWGAVRREGPSRERHLAEGMRRRRALGDALTYRLGALRAEGATLHAAHGDDETLSEDEWLRVPAGEVRFTVPELTVDEGPLRAHLLADRAARLVGLAAALGAVRAVPSPSPAEGIDDVRAAVRALRGDERAIGEGGAPSGLVPIGRSVVYDPVTGWFAPTGMASVKPASASRVRLLLDLGVVPSPAPWGVVAGPSSGLHARLSRWLTARGATSAQRDASHLEVRVAGARVPPSGERPALETLVRAALEDPSGDSAVALAGLLAGAPWTYSDPLDPASVASKVAARHAPAAARGVSRLVERSVLARDVTGALDDVRACLTDPSIRPVLALAVERALGHLDVLPPGVSLAAEARAARAWELASASPRAATLESVSRRFVTYARAAGLRFDLDLVRALMVGLAARPFAVLAGVSGTGKTAVAVQLARFMTAGCEGPFEDRVAVVPVRPDWIDSRGLLGYLHALHGDGAYEDTAALRVMLRAAQHPTEPHFVVLDEMNLARPEHYLAELLSAMESGAAVPLHGRAEPVPTTDGARRVPPSLGVAPNLFLLGTVNLDESTHPLSAKVLDRAWLWEFPTTPPSALLRDRLDERRLAVPAHDDERRALLEAAHDDDPERAVVLAMGRDGVGQRLDRLFDAMASHGRPFGFRVTTEALRFVHLCEREGIETDAAWRLDRAVLGKVLPRLSGTRRDLEGLLRALLAVLTGVSEGPPGGVSVGDGRVTGYVYEPLHASAAKVRELMVRAEREPFVSFTR